MSNVTRVLVVDDSRVAAELLTEILHGDDTIRVVAVASDGEKAVRAAQRLKPDVVTMDIHMPHLDGFEATRQIMQTAPTRIIIVSGSTSVSEAASRFRMIEAGALAILARPSGPGHPDHERSSRELIQTVKAMSEVKVVRRWPRASGASAAPRASAPAPAVRPETVEIVAMGASTGGPIALQEILADIPRTFPVPVLIVQHMTPGFIAGFVQWLNQACGFPVRLAEDGEPCLPGCAYVAPDNFHLGVRADKRLFLSRAAEEHGLRPSVSFLFRSVVEAFGAGGLGVLLTGMGRDGVDELLRMRKAGAITIAQDEASCVVHGMPRQAALIGAATHVLPPQEIAKMLSRIMTPR